jgi:hypothetical protein
VAEIHQLIGQKWLDNFLYIWVSSLLSKKFQYFHIYLHTKLDPNPIHLNEEEQYYEEEPIIIALFICSISLRNSHPLKALVPAFNIKLNFIYEAYFA